ncbi:MAG: D-glycerate dehydrogenase, partial [Calditerricola sp.]|nr:D-glycerate dehydrogenase [Calditerricola sp.]
MAKPYVYLTRKVDEDIVQRLAEECEVGVWEGDEPVPRDVLEAESARADGLYVMVTDRIDAALMDRAPRLKVVSTMSVGTDHIDVAAATERGILVTNTPGVLTETTADLAFALLLATARRLTEAERFLREGKWRSWSPNLLVGRDVYGATLGIIGMGRIGEAVARRAKGFAMRILYHNRRRRPEAEAALGAQYVNLDTLLRESDFVVLLTPLTPETENLIGWREFSLMKETACFINVSRGQTVDEEALVRALRERKIWAAGLDVY